MVKKMVDGSYKWLCDEGEAAYGYQQPSSKSGLLPLEPNSLNLPT